MSPTTKRKRNVVADTPPRETEAAFTPSETIYFQDGNVVLVASGVAFRVHRGQLARRSEVFRDMFVVAQQSEVEEMFDECPVVHLSDSVSAVGAFLIALYDSFQFTNCTVSEAIRVLPLVHKYSVEDLRQHLIKLLMSFFPDSLEAWRRRSQLGSREPSPDDCTALIKVGHVTPVMLPSAFYSLCQLSVQNSFQLHWSPEDIARYFVGRDAIQRDWLQFINNICLAERTECQDPETCDPALRDIFSDYRTPTDGVDPLVQITLVDLSDLCADCDDTTKEVLAEYALQMWSRLPKDFGLGTWAELRQSSGL